MTRSISVFVLAATAAVCADGPFTSTVYPALEAAGCRGCHSADGVASATRMRFPDEGAPAARVEAFGKSLARLGTLLLEKPTNRMAHAGGQRIQPGSDAESALRAWLKVLAAMPKAEVDAALRSLDEAAPGQRRAMAAVRRLTNSQYNNTVRDLLGDRTAPANQFPPEDFVNGFKNQYNAQALTPLHLEAYSAAAEKLARNAFRAGAPALVKCKPSAACRVEFVRTFGKRAFRRPLASAEVTRYDALFAKEKNFQSGAQLVLEAMLQSPSFLFRLDETDNAKWKPYAAASRLSYALWDTMPDATLMGAAERGDLSTRAGVEKAARRMLEDQRARQALDEFVSQWMRFDRVLSATKDRRKYPNFTPETATAMTREMRTFVGELVWRDRDFRELLTADYGFPNGDLASLYGVTQKGWDFEQVKFPAESERAGLLGQALFLSLTSKPDETSPTARGLFVREQLLCQHVPDPPPGVDTNLPALSESKPQSTRDRLGEHTSNESCAGCHNLIDPIGFGFEKFDAVGARREKLKLQFGRDRRNENVGKTVEVELNTSGRVAGIANSGFTSPRELGTILSNSPQCQECFVKQYFRYVTGRAEGPADRPLVKQVYERFRDSGFRFRELIISLVSALEFPGEGARVHAASHH